MCRQGSREQLLDWQAVLVRVRVIDYFFVVGLFINFEIKSGPPVSDTQTGNKRVNDVWQRRNLHTKKDAEYFFFNAEHLPACRLYANHETE